MEFDEQALNEAMDSGDLDALDKLIEQYESGDADADEATTETKPVETVKPDEKVVTTATTAAEGGAVSDATSSEKTNNADQEKVVLSKDGKHTIPYEVLEHARTKAATLEQENQQLKVIQAERDKLQLVLDKHGIDLSTDELDGKTDDELNALVDDFPAVGKVIAKQAEKIRELEGKLNQQAATVDPEKSTARQAFESIPELVLWETSDQDRMDYAKAKDAELMTDPLWQSKPVRERFLEAVRRTASAFGDAVKPEKPETKQDPAQQPQKKAKEDSLPNSPSDIGNSVRETATRGTPEYYAGLSPSQLNAEFSKLSPTEIDKILNSIDL
ncbi:MAG: hypothetical protein PHV54_00940 [Tolumonas sp.]|nr:hypothetical protein [Tolumonas sp.]